MYTKEQLDALRRAKDGFVWVWHLDGEQDQTLRYLMDCGLIEPREDIRQNHLRITQKGKQELQAFDDSCYQLAKSKADKRAEKRSDRCFQLFNSVLVATLSFLLGLAAGNLGKIIDFFAQLLSPP